MAQADRGLEGPTDSNVKGGTHADELVTHERGIVWCLRPQSFQIIPGRHVVVVGQALLAGRRTG